jgi:hypothetical protein
MTPAAFVRALPLWAKSVPSWFEQKYWARHHAMLIRTNQTISLYELVCQQRLALGPMKSGGVIHKITDAQAVTVTQALYKAAMAATLPPGITRGDFIALLFAWVRGESGFDPNCIDPNLQDAKPNETPYDTFLHTDVGIAQIDGSELVGLFPDFSWEQARDSALDPSWACPQMSATILAVITWGRQMAAFLGANGYPVPPDSDDPVAPFTAFVLGAEAYNAGRTGALIQAFKALAIAGLGNVAQNFAIHDGTIVLKKNAKPTDYTATSPVVTASPGNLLYGNTVRSRWVAYKALLGPVPVLGC